jgi:hypothetical protein
MQKMVDKMKFTIVEERLCNFPTKKTTFKRVANSIATRILNSDLTEIVLPIKIVAKQNKLNVTITTEKIGENNFVYFDFNELELAKAIHIVALSTVLN